MIGQPKFSREDLVSFIFQIDGKDTKLDGAVYVVDPLGTSEQSEEPSYDIEALYQGEIVLFKHIRESLVSKRDE